MGKARRRQWVRFRFIVLLIIIALAAGGSLLYARPLPALHPISTFVAPAPKSPATLTWPSNVEAAVGAVNYGVLATSGDQTPRPIASVAKVITALAVLKQHPLTIGEQGPSLILDDTDVAFYNQYAAEDGSVATVQAGEQLSEYQALQTMLLPSANNMADSLARWAYGSLPAYTAAANQLVKSWGLIHTTVGIDGSGFDPSTMSTANDLLNLGLTAMQNPVLAQIVSESQAVVPVAGTITNTNGLLGQSGIVGLKTGNTDQAGGVFIGVTQQTLGGRKLTILSTVIGTANLGSALSTSMPLLSSAVMNFSNVTIKAGTVVGTYALPWGGTTQAITQHNISLITWNGTPLKPTVSLHTISLPLGTSQPVGSLTFTAGPNTASAPLLLNQAINRPSFWWQITHR